MISDYIDEFTIKSLDINKNAQYSIYTLDACELLTVNRIDLIAKYMFILFDLQNIQSELAYETYKNHIEIFSEGRFYEPGSSTKNSLEKFISEFRDIYESVKNNGFDRRISVIPIGNDGALINGAHRAAVSLYLKLNVDVVQLKEYPGECYDYKYFLRKNINKKHMDFMALNYIKLTCRNVYAICIWPRAVKKNKEKELEELVSSTTNVIYKKAVRFNKNGLKQLTIHLYSNQEWIGSTKNNYSGAFGKYFECYDDADTVFYFVEGGDLSSILEIKNKLRKIYEMGKHSLHITDTKDEALLVAELVLNDNSINALNYGKPEYLYKDMENLTISYKHIGEKYILNPMYTLRMYGYDVKCSETFVEINSLPRDVRYDISNYFYYMGLKFVSPYYAAELVDKEYENMFFNIINLQKVPFSVIIKEKYETIRYILKRNIKAFLREIGVLQIIYRLQKKINSSMKK